MEVNKNEKTKKKIVQSTNLLCTEELAQVLNVKPSWIYSKSRQKGENKIPLVRVGKYLRFRLEEVMAWLGND